MEAVDLSDISILYDVQMFFIMTNFLIKLFYKVWFELHLEVVFVDKHSEILLQLSV
jgi:hypothetical protein